MRVQRIENPLSNNQTDPSCYLEPNNDGSGGRQLHQAVGDYSFSKLLLYQ